MKTFSRWMPPAPEHKTSIWAWPILALMAAGALYLIYTHPCSLIIVIAVAIFVSVWTLLDNRKMRKFAAHRADDSICTFVRSFNLRGTDTWLLRAVYEEFSRYLAVDGRPLPIRADDHWEEDFRIDPEDLDDLIVDIAHRAGRSLEDSERNPFFGRVKTVRDLVRFLEHQPKSR